MKRRAPLLKPLARHVRLIQAVGGALWIPFLILSDYYGTRDSMSVLVGMSALALFGLLVGKRPVVRTPVDGPLGLLLLLVPLNLLAAADRVASFPHAVKTIAGIVLFYAVAGVIKETKRLRLAGWAICLMGVLLIPVVLFGTSWTGSQKLSWIPYTISRTLPVRFRPFWKPSDYRGFNVNLGGGALAMVAPVPIAYALFAGGRRRKAGAGAAASTRPPAPARRLPAAALGVLICGMMLLTQSRGAILAVIVAVGVMLAARDWRWFIVVAVVAAAAVMVLQTGLLPSPVPLDLESDAASAALSAAGRMALYARAVYMIRDFPYTGIGIGLVNQMLSHRYPLFSTAGPTELEHLHNMLLHTGAEMGIPGMVALGAFLIGLLALTWQAAHGVARRPAAAEGARGGDPPLAIGMLGVVVVICVHGITDAVTFSPRASFIAWVLFGAAAGVAMVHSRSPRHRKRRRRRTGSHTANNLRAGLSPVARSDAEPSKHVTPDHGDPDSHPSDAPASPTAPKTG